MRQKRNAWEVLVVKLASKWTLGRSRVRWARNIEVDYEKKESRE